MPLDQPGLEQWGEGQCCGGRVATRRSDRRRALQIVTEELGQAVHELAEQMGNGVGFAVPDGIELGVLQAEVGGQVDDPPHLAQDVGQERL